MRNEYFYVVYKVGDNGCTMVAKNLKNQNNPWNNWNFYTTYSAKRKSVLLNTVPIIVFESYSAGTETKPQINQDAVRIMKELYGIDMEQTQYSKLISDIPNPDVAISMGCNVGCPFIGRAFDDNWGLEDPTGKSDEEFKKIISEIESKIIKLRDEVL